MPSPNPGAPAFNEQISQAVALYNQLHEPDDHSIDGFTAWLTDYPTLAADLAILHARRPRGLSDEEYAAELAVFAVSADGEPADDPADEDGEG